MTVLLTVEKIAVTNCGWERLAMRKAPETAELLGTGAEEKVIR